MNTLKKVSHANIVHQEDATVKNRTVFLITEPLQSQTLQTLIDAQRKCVRKQIMFHAAFSHVFLTGKMS